MRGDACNLFDIPDEGATVKRKLAVPAAHWAQVGRPFDAIEKTISTRFTPAESPAQFVHRLEQMTVWGLDHPVVITSGPWTEQAFGRGCRELARAALRAGPDAAPRLVRPNPDAAAPSRSAAASRSAPLVDAVVVGGESVLDAPQHRVGAARHLDLG
jgi:hypothetical protein